MGFLGAKAIWQQPVLTFLRYPVRYPDCSTEMKKTDKPLPGITVRSCAVGLLSLVILAVLVEFVAIVDSWYFTFGSEPLAIPAVQILLLLIGIVTICRGLGRWNLLSREELLCVFYALLIASPLMATGFWQRTIAATATVAKSGNFERYEALKPDLWPHGDNVLDGVMQSGSAAVTVEGGVSWENVQILTGREVTVPRLVNTEPGQNSRVALSIDLFDSDGAYSVYPGQPYILSVLIRARELEGQSYYYCRVHADTLGGAGQEVFMERRGERRTYTNRYGFVRSGMYGLELPASASERIIVEIGLRGQGVIEIADPQLMDVTAIEYAYRGKRVVAAGDYDALTQAQRIGLVRRPERILSREGLVFYLSGHIPYGDWIPPLSRWIALALLIITAMFACAAIMRRQWVQSERYPLPLAQIPLALIGERVEGSDGVASVWSDKLMWGGAVVAFLWCMSALWYNWNSSAPNLSINVPLKSYLADGGWGKTWNGVNLTLYPLFFSIGLFMELNVLMSLVVGFLLFRLQFWFGEANGLVADVNYPYQNEQILGAYIAYGILTLLFSRKYLWSTVKKAISGEKNDGEVLSYRSSYTLLLASFAGAFLWAQWVGVTPSGVLVFFLFMVLTSFVAMKLRAECGTPHQGFVADSGDALQRVLPLIGGIAVLGADGMLVGSLALLFFGVTFFNLPGMQLELIESGRRFNIRRSHLIGACVMGVLGAFVIGGWVYLSNAYGYGADNYFRSPGLFGIQEGAFEQFGIEMTNATERMLAQESGGQQAGRVLSPTVISFGFGAIVTTALALLRQIFAGFWFHPVGFILGGTEMMRMVWGSLFFAWLVRFAVLRLGGAVTVRSRLKPFAVGVLVGTVVSYGVATVINGYIFFFNYGAKEFRGLF